MGRRDRAEPATLEILIADSMTASTAAAAILVLFDGTVFSANVFPFPSEIIRMTGSAEGRVLGPGIRNVFVIVFVTRPTAHVATVVARIAAVIWMRVIDRRPALRGMTGVTFRYGNKMII